MALLLQLRTRAKMNTFINPSLFHFYTTSNSKDDESESSVTSTDDTASTNPNPSVSSYFSDVKMVLKQGQSTSPRLAPRNSLNSSFTASGSAASTLPKSASLDEIRKNLSEFRRHSNPDSTPPSSPSSNPISLQEIYRRNMAGKPGDWTPNADRKPGKMGGRPSFDVVRESMRNMKLNVETSGSDRKVGELPSLSSFAQSLRREPSDSIGSRRSTGIGEMGALPNDIFGKELREKSSEVIKMDWVKVYNHEELGEKLRELRPQAKGRDWFSLRELNDRLMKLRDIEEEKEKEKVKEQPTREVTKMIQNVLIDIKQSNNDERKRSRK